MVINEFYTKRLVNKHETKVIYNKSRLDAHEIVALVGKFTETYKQHIHSHKAIREAECLAVQYPASMLGVMDNDLFVGRFDTFPVLFNQQVTPLPNTGLGYTLREDWIKDLKETGDLSSAEKELLDNAIHYWRPRHTKQKFYNTCSYEAKQYMPYPHYTKGPGAYFTLFRVAGIYLDYAKLLRLGLPGLIDEIELFGKAHPEDPGLFEGMKRAITVVIDTVCFYYNMVKDMSEQEENAPRKQELKDMTEVLLRISSEPPESFREALQLAYLYSAICGAREYGRMDEYLGDYFVRDLEQGRLTEEEAVALMESLWRIIISREQITDDRIIIGGPDRKNEHNADRLALAIMEASRRVNDIVPQLTLRCYKGMNQDIYKKALDMLGEGCTFPMLLNDDVNIPAVMKVFGLTHDEANEYLPLGCGEYTVNHSRISSPNAAINMLEVLLCTLNNGRETMTGHQLVPDRGNLIDFSNFDELWHAYVNNIEYLMRITAEQTGTLYKVLARECALNFITPLYDDCLRRGKALLDGGVRGLDAIVEVYGLVNTSDSLVAIKRLVFEEKRISAERMLEVLNNDFEEADLEHRMMLDVPKFGNDLSEADDMMAKVHEHVSYAAMAQSGKYGLDRFLIVNINNNVNTLWGRWTPASPDGRRRGKPMSNGNNPSSGMDVNGLTAFLNSLLRARVDIHAGVVQNMKFSKEMFCRKRGELEAALEAYFEKGGAQAMPTVVGREDLENARKTPEKYGNLMVRVGGFSARYVELDDDVQREILERTLY